MGSACTLVTGATGLVGKALLQRLLERGGTVHALTRRESPSPGDGKELRTFRWDGQRVPDEALEGLDAVVHLAGEPIFGGYPSFRRMDRVVASRVESTQTIVSQLAALEPEQRPRVLVCASAVGFYGSREDERLDEASSPGRGFLPQLCIDWEAAAEGARELGMRVVRLRFGVILSRDGGALPTMRRAFELKLGGRFGNGRQWFPWVHIDDAIAATLLAVDREQGDGQLDGPVNVVAPVPVTNRELTHELATRLDEPGFWIVPGFVLRAALSEIADELLGSRRVSPDALERARFRFRYRELGPALDEALP